MKKLIIIAGVLVLALALTACQATDVVGKVSITSFEEMTNNLPEAVTTDDANGGWSIKSPNGERFVWSKDFSAEGKPDFMMEFDVKPFIAAGLDPTKLDTKTYLFDSMGSMLMVHSEQGADKFKNDSTTKPMDTFKEIVKTHRDSINYHETLDHYGIIFGGGNMFEWAKDITTNDKDMVFVLNPQPLIDAGLDPTKVEGWIFAKVEVKDANGKKEIVDKLLKPYNLK